MAFLGRKRDFSKGPGVEIAKHFEGRLSKEVDESLEIFGESELGSCLAQLDWQLKEQCLSPVESQLESHPRRPEK